MDRNKELKVHRLRLPGRSLCSIRSNRKWCKRRGSSLQCQNCFFVYPIIDCNLKNLEGGTAMLRKLNSFLNIVIGSFIGVFIGFGIYKFWHFKTYPNLYAMQSAPWYTELLLDGAMVAVLVVVCIILKLIIWRKIKS